MGDQAKEKLIKSDEFEKALAEGAEFKREIMTTYKEQNKANYKQFQEIMFESNPEVKAILSKRKKDRTDVEIEQVKKFKASVAASYRQTIDLITPEDLEEGKLTKAEKISAKLMPVLQVLAYIGNDVLAKQLYALGLNITPCKTLEQEISGLNDPGKRECIKQIFESAKSIKQKADSDQLQITENVFAAKVPVELQYDKKTNNAGLKPGDFMKLVDMKAKLMMAKSDEAKAKVEEKIEEVASEKQFEAARAELVRDKLASMQ